jgi:hypothetical protein
MVEGDVADCDVLLEIGRTRDPFPEPLRQDEVVVGVGK